MERDDAPREPQELAPNQRTADKQPRSDAAYAPLPPLDKALYEAVLAKLQRENAAKPVPDRICRVCGFPTEERDADPLFKKLCSTCGSRRVDRLMRRARRRLGRKAAIRALKRLARGT
jgi:hypothetical protein